MLLLTLFFLLSLFGISGMVCAEEVSAGVSVKLPPPQMESEMSIEECLASRRSVRSFSNEPLNLQHVSQLMWAAQGITSEKGQRTAPSAGAKYPIEIYLVATNVTGLDKAIYRYQPAKHELIKIRNGAFRDQLCAAAIGQKCVSNAPATIVIAAEVARTRKKYGDRSERYVNIEVGSVCQNIYLQAESLGLGTVAVGAFDDNKVLEILSETYSPLLMMPIGLKP